MYGIDGYQAAELDRLLVYERRSPTSWPVQPLPSHPIYNPSTFLAIAYIPLVLRVRRSVDRYIHRDGPKKSLQSFRTA